MKDIRNDGKFVYKIINEGDKTAKIGDESEDDGNGFVEKTNISGIIIVPEFINNYKIISLGNYAFRECNKITKIILPRTLIEIKSQSLTTVRNIKSLVIPASVTTIGNRMDWFNNLIHFRFEEGTRITIIGDYFLQNCWKLEKFEIPSCITSIGSYLTYQCNVLKTIYYCGLNTFDNITNAFNECPEFIQVIVTMEYPASLFGQKSTSIQEFYNCHNTETCPTVFIKRKINFQFFIFIFIQLK